MRHHHHDGAAAPGPVTPESDDARELGGCAGTKGQGTERGQKAAPIVGAHPHVGQALKVIEGEGKAAQYLARLQAQRADPDELAQIVSMLYGAALRGFCRAVEKALGVQHV